MKSSRFFLVLYVFCLGIFPAFARTPYADTFQTSCAGALEVSCPDSNGWRIEIGSKENSRDREVVRFHFSRETAAVPPALTLSFNVPLVDMSHIWFSTNINDRCAMKPEWAVKFVSQIARDMPLVSCFNDADRNRLTVACSESFRNVNFSCGVKEEGTGYSMTISFFSAVEAPIEDYTMDLLFDRREMFWADSISEASSWIMQSSSLSLCRVPDAAYEPLYSTWYQFHQDVSADAVEKECILASALGMKTVILDDGWQTDDNSRGYAYCGDWKVSRKKFPDMKAHVDAVHKLGMKYMVWYSVPYVGHLSTAFDRFKGMYLYDVPSAKAAVLDPRFPEVREYLSNLYVNAMTEYGYDGFKLDFIDKFRIEGEDPAVRQNYAGRDIKSLPHAVDVLMESICSKLHNVNDDVLIEFRQRYVGPAIRQYGNMFRVGDCPADYHSNRINIANLRMTSGSTAVHSDMLEWNLQERPEAAARQILNSIFGVIQYSVMLKDLPESHGRMLRHWISFSEKHRETLLHGRFIPHCPQAGFPVIEARSDAEQVCALYQEGVIVQSGSDAHESYIINATGSDEVFVSFQRKPRFLKVYDTFGNEVSARRIHIRKKQLFQPVAVKIPESGYARIQYTRRRV